MTMLVTGEDIAHIERALAQDRSRSAIVEDTPSIRRLRGGR